MEYYKEKIDIEKVNLKNIDKDKLLRLRYSILNGVCLDSVIREMLEEKGCTRNVASPLSSKIEEDFHKRYPVGIRNVKEITERYRKIFEELPQKYNVQQYTDSYGDINVNSFLTAEENKLLEKYKNAKEIEEKKEGIEIHNITIDLLDRITENFDKLYNNAKEDMNYQQKEAKKAILKNQYVWAGIILCIIFICVFWNMWGPWTILIAPIGVLVLVIAIGLYDEVGRYRYGSKWDRMTPYEQGTQVKKDNFINSLNNKR